MFARVSDIYDMIFCTRAYQIHGRRLKYKVFLLSNLQYYDTLILVVQIAAIQVCFQTGSEYVIFLWILLFFARIYNVRIEIKNMR